MADELVKLADELDGWHDCADGDVSAGNGHFRVKPDNEVALEAVAALKRALAEAVEVMRPFAAIDATGWTGSYLSDPPHNTDDVSVLHHSATKTTVTLGHFRAARAFVAQHGSK